MKNTLLLASVFFTGTLYSQYYYNDLIGTSETNRQMQVYLANKVKTMSATGYDQRGMKSTDFSEYHEILENGRGLKASSIVNLNKIVVYSRFDDKGRVISMTDSSGDFKSITSYSYDPAGRISLVENRITDTANDFNQVESHQWLYGSSGKPEKMWRIITNTANPAAADSLEVRFFNDENGNTGEERTFKKGMETGYLYYYYDEKNRLSDIVRYNTKVKKLLPDLMFEYDENNRVIQKITTVSNLLMGGYLIWRYIFNEKGLKTKEALFNKDKELTGKIDYSYTFNQ